MNTKSIAPCGVNCDICLGFQREKDKCVGCNNEGNKPNHCMNCSIVFCLEKKGNIHELCYKCNKFPCRRIKDLDKRYKTKYGESVIENLNKISESGIRVFIQAEKIKWKCEGCGKLVCVHREYCLYCGARNNLFPAKV